MASSKLRDVKVGEAIVFNNDVWIVFARHEQAKGNKRTLWQIKLKNLEKGNVFEQRFSPDDTVEKVMINREEWEYLYSDGQHLIFMHPESFEQINLDVDLVPEAQRGFLVPNARMNLLKVQEKIAQIELPQQVTVEVTDAPESARGDTATNVTKLVTIETGAEVRVPGYIKKGEKVKIRCEDGEFMGRAN